MLNVSAHSSASAESCCAIVDHIAVQLLFEHTHLHLHHLASCLDAMSVLSSSAASAYDTHSRIHNPRCRLSCLHLRLLPSPACRLSYSHSVYFKSRALSTRQPTQNSRKRRFCVSAGAQLLSTIVICMSNEPRAMHCAMLALTWG